MSPAVLPERQPPDIPSASTVLERWMSEPLSRIRIEGRDYDFVVDTGATVSL
jgi:hypothetical protein